VAERHPVERRRIGREEAACDLVGDPAERVVAVRVPNAEDVPSTGGENAAGLTVRSVFVGEEHHPELAGDGIEGAIREGQRRGVGGLELDLFAGPELAARHREHGRIEVGRREARSWA
jgi:hypothetical protein